MSDDRIQAVPICEDGCAWLAGCDDPPRYLAFYGPCDNPKCTTVCCGALVCEKHAAQERANPTLTRITALPVVAGGGL